MAKNIYIDTDMPLHNMFKAPASFLIGSEYCEWLEAKYRTSYVSYGAMKVYFGVGQRINHIIYKATHTNSTVIISGRFAKAAAETIKKISNGLVEPVVLNGKAAM